MPLLRTPNAIPRIQEPLGLRRLSLSLVHMAVLTGVVLRIYRATVLQFGWSDSWVWVGGTFVLGLVALFLMATLHLGNYPERTWWWRAPLFALLEASTEMAVSLVLTVLGLEVVGSITATFEDWADTAARLVFLRVVGISVFALVLALVSLLVRQFVMRAPKES